MIERLKEIENNLRDLIGCGKKELLNGLALYYGNLVGVSFNCGQIHKGKKYLCKDCVANYEEPLRKEKEDIISNLKKSFLKEYEEICKKYNVIVENVGYDEYNIYGLEFSDKEDVDYHIKGIEENL